MCSATDESTSTRRAPKDGPRRIRANNIPGRSTSCAYTACPVTRASASIRRTSDPITVKSRSLVSGTSLSISRSIVWPSISWPYVNVRPGSAFEATLPLRITRSSLGKSSRREASSSSASRAVAAATRSCNPTRAVDWLPNVPISHGVWSVSPRTTSTADSGIRSSSATSTASPVRMFWPYSTFPAKIVTRPSGRTSSQRAKGVSGLVFPYARVP